MEAGGGLLSEQAVRERAYYIWEREGRPHGRDHEHWAMAERELFTAGMPSDVARPEVKSANTAAKAGAAEAAGAKGKPRKRSARAAGAAVSTKRGKGAKNSLEGAFKSVYETMSEKQLEEVAETKRKGKPRKKS